MTDVGARPLLIAHVIHRLAVGGLENGLVNLINRLDPARFRHAVICMTEYSDFAARIRRDDVRLVALGKRPGQDLGALARLWRCLRGLRPDIVHTRNIGTLECQIVARLAGAPARIHGEHGFDASDVDGSNRRYRMLRRAIAPLVHRFVPMSRDLAEWLERDIGIVRGKIFQIYNGVDADRFRPGRDRSMLPPSLDADGALIVGTVGRLDPIKNHTHLVAALGALRRRHPWGERVRAVIAGDGPARPAIEAAAREHGVADAVWLAGNVDDVPALLRSFDVYCLPSSNEGISNTILEAMATGLPVVASNVGGNPELVLPGRTGTLFPAGDVDALAGALAAYLGDEKLRTEHGTAARDRVLMHFSLDRMVQAYAELYRSALLARS